MAKAPAFQFYAKDWLSSPRVQLMTPAQRGAYIHLLAYCWESGDCSLPDDDAKLAALSGLNQEWFNGSSTTVRECFILHPTKAHHLTNQRLHQERIKQDQWVQKCVDAGLKSAEKRRKTKGKKKSKVSSTNAQPKHDSTVQLNGNSASASALVSLSEILFEKFWKAFPRRVGRQKAAESFAKVCPDEATLTTIIAGVERWKLSRDWANEGGKYIPHPTTFLNQRRWEEDPAPDLTTVPKPSGEKVVMVDGKLPPGWEENAPPMRRKTEAGAP